MHAQAAHAGGQDKYAVCATLLSATLTFTLVPSFGFRVSGLGGCVLDAAHIPLRCLGRIEVQRIARAPDHRRRLRERPGYRQCQDHPFHLDFGLWSPVFLGYVGLRKARRAVIQCSPAKSELSV